MVGLLLEQATHQACVGVLPLPTDELEESCGLGETPWVRKRPSVMLCDFQSGMEIRVSIQCLGRSDRGQPLEASFPCFLVCSPTARYELDGGLMHRSPWDHC